MYEGFHKRTLALPIFVCSLAALSPDNEFLSEVEMSSSGCRQDRPWGLCGAGSIWLGLTSALQYDPIGPMLKLIQHYIICSLLCLLYL